MSFEDQPPASALPVLRPGAEPGAAPLSQLSADPLGAARAENEEDSGGSFGLWKIHSMLRGRYLILSLVGLLTGGMAAVVGWRSAHPIYFSEGLIRIAYSLPVVEKQTDENAPMPMFTEFMQSQAILIKSRRAIDSAVVNPVWKAMGQTVPDPADQYYAEHLNVEIRGDSEMIRITVRDQQPVLAAAAVTAIEMAYSDIYNSQDKQTDRNRIDLLENHQTELQGQIDQLQVQIRDKAAEYGTTHLDTFFDAAEQQVMHLEQALADVRLALAGTPATQPGSNTPAASTGTESVVAVDEMTLQRIAMSDPAMRQYLLQRDQYRDELSQYQANGYGEANEGVVQLKQRLAAETDRVNKYAHLFLEINRSGEQPVSDPARAATAPPVGLSSQSLREREASLEQMLTEAKAEMVKLGDKSLDLQLMQSQLDSMTAEESNVSGRIDSLRGEGALGGRLTVVGTGEVPLSPTIDHRLAYAGAAGLGGFLLPAGLTLLVSAARHRYRYADETVRDNSLGNIPLLGMLPDVDDEDDDQDMLNVAHGIHHLRLLLCSRSGNEARGAYLVTSAREGEGKTNLTIALGISFAAAKHKTLIIDGDFISRRVTRGFGEEDSDGFYDAMIDGHLGNRVRSLRNGLFLLPSGRVSAADACTVDAPGVKALLDEAMAQYDTVLIDSGPILGSLEATVLAPLMNGVLLTISRGQDHGLVQTAVHRLGSVGAHLAGAVFNRAHSRDYYSSAYASTSTSVPAAPRKVPEPEVRSGPFFEFGPLVSAVARTCRHGMNGNGNGH